MLQGIEGQRALQMTARERRLFDNVKKAFHDSDVAMRSGRPEDKCLQELFNGIDAAKTLRNSLLGQDCSRSGNRTKFIEFLSLEIPAPESDDEKFPLRERPSGKDRRFGLCELIYDIRCMLHENENLSAAEAIDYHVLLDWSSRCPRNMAEIHNGTFICNGFFLWNRLREILAKFITGLTCITDLASGATSVSMTISPAMESIRPTRHHRVVEE
jgi:hypothetical protein